MKNAQLIGLFSRGGSYNVLFAIRKRLRETLYFYFAEDQHELMAVWCDEDMVVAADLLALMSEHYDISPQIPAERVVEWRQRYLEAFFEHNGFDLAKDRDKQPLEYLAAFDRLEAAARQRPPEEF